MYISQKEYTEKNCDTETIKKCTSLFANDFTDFKEKLNEAIRALNQLSEKYRFHLAILGKDNQFTKQMLDIESELNTLKTYYNRDKSLYTVPAITTALANNTQQSNVNPEVPAKNDMKK